ncbi:MAG: hypothetical protein PVG65_06215, partial [Candidatus Thorarchaeota archaeon]
DAGTFELSPPFLDRFGIAVPITMPTVNDLELILSSRDEKLFGYDELWQVPAILKEEDLLTIWNLADKVSNSQSASEFMRSIVREFGACIRTNKSQSGDLTVETGLCDNCHFNTAKSVCNKVVIPLSVRAVKDLNRYAKAVTWLIGIQEVSIGVVKALAPLVFWHRTRYVRDAVESSPFYGDKFAFTQHLVELASARFTQREAAIAIMAKFRLGAASQSNLDELKEIGKSDLLVRIDHLRLAKELKKKRYVKMVQNIEKSIDKENVKELTKAHEVLLNDSEFPNRPMLLTKISDALHKLTLSQFTVTFEQWQEMWTSISLNFPELTKVLKETLEPPKRKVMRTNQLTLVVYTTGDSSESPVFVEVSGGEDALSIQKELKKQIETWEK